MLRCIKRIGAAGGSPLRFLLRSTVLCAPNDLLHLRDDRVVRLERHLLVGAPRRLVKRKALGEVAREVVQ